MDARRDTFIFYRSFLKGIEAFEDAEQLTLYKAIAHYALDGVEPQLSGMMRMYFEMARPNLDANTKRYLNGKKGGAPEGSHNNPYGRGGKKADAEASEQRAYDPRVMGSLKAFVHSKNRTTYHKQRASVYGVAYKKYMDLAREVLAAYCDSDVVFEDYPKAKSTFEYDLRQRIAEFHEERGSTPSPALMEFYKSNN